MDIINNINAGMYKTNLPYEYTIIPVDEDVMTVTQAKAHLEQQKLAKASYREFYRQDGYRLELKFRNDIAAHFNVTGHMKEPLLWGLAYNYGHSGGYIDIFNYYEDLIQLVV